MDLHNLTQIIQILRYLPDKDRHYLATNLNDCTLEQLFYYIKDYNSETLQETEELAEFPEYQLGEKLLLYASPILLVIGTIGNILAFLVLKAQCTKVSTYSYLAALAVMDLLVLYIGLLRLWVAKVTGIDIRDRSDWLCKFVMFFAYVCSYSSVWLIIIVTLERYVAVRYPLRAASLCKMKRAKVLAYLPVFVFCVANSHFFWTVSINPFNDEVKCVAKPSFSIIVNEVWPWIDAVLYSFCPSIVITVLNCLILQQVYIAKGRRRMYLQHNKKNTRIKGTEASTRLTFMLLAVSFSFLLTTLPMNVTLIVSHFWNHSQTRDLHRTAVLFLVQDVTVLLMYLNHSINFFLYCATGEKFRTTLGKLLCTRRCSTSDDKRLIMRGKYAHALSRYGTDRTGECVSEFV